MFKKVDPVVAECLRLSEIHDLDEKYRGWLALWQEHLEGVDIATVSVVHVEAITSLGYGIAMQSKKFDEALRYLNIYFSHPDVEKIDRAFNLYHRNTLCYCLFQVGEEAQAIEIGTSLLQPERRSERTYRRALVRNSLLAYIENANPDEVASKALTDLGWTIVLAYKRRPIRRQLPEQATYRALTEILMKPPMSPKVDKTTSL